MPITLPGPAKDKEKVVLKLGPTLITGGAIKDADVSVQNNRPQVDFEMTSDGTTRFAEVTLAAINRQVAIVFDYNVLSAPNVKETITGGKANISGGYTAQEARNLAIVLNTGALPVELKLVSEDRI